MPIKPTGSSQKRFVIPAKKPRRKQTVHVACLDNRLQKRRAYSMIRISAHKYFLTSSALQTEAMDSFRNEKVVSQNVQNALKTWIIHQASDEAILKRGMTA